MRVENPKLVVEPGAGRTGKLAMVAYQFQHNPNKSLCAVPAGKGRVWHNFSKWLREHGDLYWMNGKAGLGKSALIRHICDNEITYKFLKSWAGISTLRVINF